MDSNKHPSAVAAIVLAAGMSRRMGKPKQLLRWRDKSLLEHTLSNIRASRVSEIVVVLGAAADEIGKQIGNDNLKLVLNPDYQQGMGTSLRTGVSALSASAKAALVVLADQPFIRPATLDQLIAGYEQSAPQVLLPLYRGFRGNPVLLDRAMFPELMALSGDVGCRAIFGQHTHGIHRLEVGDPGILLDIDSAEDWEALNSSLDPIASLQRMPEVETRDTYAAGKPELAIVGRDAIAHALASFACLMGFSVTVVDPLKALDELPSADRALHVLDFSRLATAERYVVVASRGQFDEDALEQAVRCSANYCGLLANQKRANEIFQSLEARGIGKEKLSSVRVPAGLKIGAETAQEIALSIMAEIVAARRNATQKAQIL